MPLDATKWTRVNCTDSHSYLHSPILSCLCVHDISVSKKMLQVFSTQQHEGRFYQSAVFPVTIIRHLTFHHKLSYMYDFFTSPHPPPPTPTKTNKQTYKKHTRNIQWRGKVRRCNIHNRVTVICCWAELLCKQVILQFFLGVYTHVHRSIHMSAFSMYMHTMYLSPAVYACIYETPYTKKWATSQYSP